MGDTNSMPSDLQRQQDRKRKGKAILAGGVVLGLGAAVTLAAWSDDVFADGLFATDGTFELEASAATAALPATTDWQDYAGPENTTSGDDAVARLQFAATTMTPGDTVYAPFTIRTKTGTSLAGELDNVTAKASAGVLQPYLTYTIIDVTGVEPSCTAADHSGTDWVATPTAVTTTATDADLTTPNPTVGISTADPAVLCVAVTLADTQPAKDAINDATGATDTTITWDFHATQSD